MKSLINKEKFAFSSPLHSTLLKVLGAASLLVSMTSAQAAAIDFTSVNIDFTNNAWSLGFKFKANQNLTVNRLGFYDDEKNGLTERHDVGIFNSTGTLLGSTTVSNSDSLDGWFRYHGVSAISLVAGETYYIAAETGTENYTYDPNGFTVDPSISFIDNRFVLASTLTFPSFTTTTVDKGYFGPNFDATIDVPEPAMLGLLGLGLVGLVGSRRRKVA